VAVVVVVVVVVVIMMMIMMIIIIIIIIVNTALSLFFNNYLPKWQPYVICAVACYQKEWNNIGPLFFEQLSFVTSCRQLRMLAVS
jgi:hypothetical protein